MIIEAKLALAAAAFLFLKGKQSAPAKTSSGASAGSVPVTTTKASASGAPLLQGDAPGRYLGGGTVSNRMLSESPGNDRAPANSAPTQGGASVAGILGGLARAGGAVIDRAVMATPVGRGLGLFGVTPSTLARSAYDATAASAVTPAAVTNSQSSAFADEINAEQATISAQVETAYSVGDIDAVFGGYGVNDYGGRDALSDPGQTGPQ